MKKEEDNRKLTKEEDNRKLTKVEERRNKEYEKIKEEMLKLGYEERDLTIGIVYANVMAFIMALPFIVLFSILFSIGKHSSFSGMSILECIIFLIIFFICIAVHEGIHGITWAVFAENHFKSIEFGIIVESFTPYCTCKSPLKKHEYIIGAIMPTFILGILPCVVSLFTGQAVLLYFGFLMILSGGGDMTIIYHILLKRSEKKEELYLDHPYKCGTMVFEK